MRAERLLLRDVGRHAAVHGRTVPQVVEATAPERRQRATLRLERLRERQKAEDGLADLGPPPRNLLALFR